MTTLGKCARCHRRNDCALHDLAVSTLPWVEEAHASEGSDWDRKNAVRRALRGGGESPGFIEDWLFEGAITRDDASAMAEKILRSNAVSLAHLTARCRHYVGPVVDNASLAAA